MFSAAGDPPDVQGPLPFSRVRWQEGYDVRQVDAFVRRTLDDLASADPTMRPRDVRAARFRPVRLREGYAMREVDDYLDELESRLTLRHPDMDDEVAARGLRALLRTPASWTGRLTWGLLGSAGVLWLYAEAVAPRWH